MADNNYIKDVMENPSMENIVKNILNFQDDEQTDPELKALQSIVQSIIKEDMHLETPFDMMLFGMKMMAADQDAQSEEMKKVQSSIEKRL